MSIITTDFGTTNAGQQTHLYTITNANGMQAQFTDYGAIWVSAKVPTKNGFIDTMLGFDNSVGYETHVGHIGCPIGRIANRTTGPFVTINGTQYILEATSEKDGIQINNHCGPDFYENRMWDTEIYEDTNSIKFHLLSPHMDQGLPGNLHINITYSLTEDNTVKISYDAVSDEDTVFSITNHAYFNMNGKGTVWNHKLWMDSSHYTETDQCVPTGRILSVDGTPYDYRTEKTVDIELDDNWCEEPHHCLEAPRAKCTGDKTGIELYVHTDLPGIQIYTANFLDIENGKNGAPYQKGEGICFETQYYVNAMNIDNPDYKKPLLKKNTPFHSESWYQFKA